MGAGGGCGQGRNQKGGCEEGQGVGGWGPGRLGLEDGPLRCLLNSLFTLNRNQSQRLGWASLPSGHSG